MTVLVWADVHADAWRRAGLDPFASVAKELETVDALIIAGDIADNPASNWPAFFKVLGDLIDLRKVAIFPGNHDYHGWDILDDDGLAAMAEAVGIRYAQKQVIRLDGSRFVCCTLWTDFGLNGDVTAGMIAAQDRLMDYSRITVGEAHRRLRPRDVLQMHEDHLAWLDRTLAEPFPGRTIVVTHHAPHPELLDSLDLLDRLRPAYASNLEPLIRRHQPDSWICGHIHGRRDAQIGVTRLRDVALGFPHEVSVTEARALLLRGLIENGRPA
ncbi:metallophosphoesterase family protein [Paracoccus actinidiae]|uniref:metallophosphoesterase family protein n=1 Tax=Paracoccus actinidiae TaxID=3064531 RepID=UPI0027D1EF05|nr:metallophosphoesterase [Paracoccus sp. M09]